MANPQVIEDGDEIPLGSRVQPNVEAETAFILEKDLAGPSDRLKRVSLPGFNSARH